MKNTLVFLDEGNELVKSVNKYVLLSKEDFENSPLNKEKMRMNNGNSAKWK